jgi:gliding motility-associated-like protein
MRFNYKNLKYLFVLLALLPLKGICRPKSHSKNPNSSLIIYAGNDQTVCQVGDSVTLGGGPTASGGFAPYTYAWTPTNGMNNSTLANPRVCIISPMTKFHLIVTDSAGNTATDSVVIYTDSVYYSSAGSTQNTCGGKRVLLGALINPRLGKYEWSPADSLSCTTCPQPYSNPIGPITYTMTVTNPNTGCHNTSTVTLTPTGPDISTVSPVYLTQGQNTNLQASGGFKYQWWPVNEMFNPTSATPEVEIEQTYTYYVAGYDGNGCAGFDSVEVIIKGDTDLVFYNTFTPNGDGINDYWYIGNIFHYPNNDLYIYNRYGKQVYYTHGYVNQWDGKNNDQVLPAATYYYILNTNTGKTYRGSVTIIRIE